MKNLSKALMTKFNAVDINSVHTTLYTLVSGKLYKVRAKQNATLPYVVYDIVSNVPEWNFCSDFEKTRIQFRLYSDGNNSSSEVEDMYAALKELYDWKTLAIENYDHVYMKRVLASLSRDPEDDTWTYNVDYEVLMELSS